ncbi:Uncharacterised protein [Mycobacteroides abscessus subsp. massiliense]|nr:Uncharacterised protein [Mycobacteroides abscessus subsp. massiliense]
MRVLNDRRTGTGDRRLSAIRHSGLPGVARSRDVVDVIDHLVGHRQSDGPAVVGYELLLLIGHHLRVGYSTRRTDQDHARN